MSIRGHTEYFYLKDRRRNQMSLTLDRVEHKLWFGKPKATKQCFPIF